MGQHRLSRALFHWVSFRKAVPPRYDDERFWRRFQEYGVASAERFFSRLGAALDVEGKSVLDVGAGRGEVLVELARRGAARVVGIDQIVAPQLLEMIEKDPRLAGTVEMVGTDGSLRELDGQVFDVVLSKDSFEHFSDPESLISTLVGLLRPGGRLVIGFGPLWKSPTGGHIEYVTPLPWAHLLFPEDVIMEERRRFRPDDDARSFEEIPGGLNRMTLRRFEAIMGSSGLETEYFATNVSGHPAVKVMRALSRIRPLRELFTTNVYGIWRKPERA